MEGLHLGRVSRRTALKTAVCALTMLTMPAAARKRRVVVIASRCVGCGDCRKICPANAMPFIEGKVIVDDEKCIGCALCVTICSYGAIVSWKE